MNQRGNPLSLLIGAGIGAAIMYFLDPNRGVRRRHLAYDRAGRVLRVGKRELHDARENAKNHALGAMREVKSGLRGEGRDVDDEVLVARVRAELGHNVESARSIEVFAENGCVTLCGSALVHEIDRAERTVKGVRGVTGVNNELVPIELSFDVPPMPGEGGSPLS
jgi:hypothetical protein